MNHSTTQQILKRNKQLIDGTVKKVKGGSGLVERTNDAFSKVSESSSKVGELIAEISAASNEQAQGIEQTNTASLCKKGRNPGSSQNKTRNRPWHGGKP